MTLALEAVHALGAIHRDVKPSNVLVSATGYLMLSDFGLSNKPGTSSRSGTRGYWSPETVRKEPQGEAADWWSFGIMLGYLATGSHPLHRRWGRDAASDAPPAPWEVVAGEGGEGKVGDGGVGGHGRQGEGEAVKGEAGEIEAGERELGERGGRRLSEKELNYNTLHMPIQLPANMDAPLAALLGGLLERDPHRRLGSGGVEEVRGHAFFGDTFEWSLLEQQQLPAPYMPDPNLVYVQDDIPTLSGSLEIPSERLLGDLADWDCVVQHGYPDELREFVRKSSTRKVLKTMEAPPELGDALPKDDEADEVGTHTDALSSQDDYSCSGSNTRDEDGGCSDHSDDVWVAEETPAAPAGKKRV